MTLHANNVRPPGALAKHLPLIRSVGLLICASDFNGVSSGKANFLAIGTSLWRKTSQTRNPLSRLFLFFFCIGCFLKLGAWKVTEHIDTIVAYGSLKSKRAS